MQKRGTVKGLKWINNGIRNKRVKLEELDLYRRDGWVEGQLPTTLGKVWVNKDEKNTLVPKDNLDYYLSIGYNKGKLSSELERNVICVNKDGITKRIQKDRLSDYLEEGWTKGVHYNYRWITDGNIERWTDDPLKDGWREGRLLDNPNDLIDMYNNKEVIKVEKYKMHDYENKGYIVGKGKKVGLYEGSTKNTIWINDGINTKLIRKDEDIPDGWEKGSLLVRGIVVNNGISNKLIKASDLTSYLDRGYVVGSLYKNHLGKVWIHREDERKFIDPSEFNYYVDAGWLLGSGIKPVEDKIVINKDGISKYVSTEDLEYYLNDGWSSGRISDHELVWINNGIDEKLTSLDDYNLNYRQNEWKFGKLHTFSIPEYEFSKLLDYSKIAYDSEYYINHNDKRYFFDFKVGNILIEINPWFTHNSTVGPQNVAKDVNYHFEKCKAARENGFRCVCIWDWDDESKIVSSLLERPIIHARKCEVKEVSIKDSTDFINKYHFQNYVKDLIRLGLYYNDELISIMTFGKPRYNKSYDYELLRYCSSYNVVGGAEKLFSYFNKNYNFSSIISYCDFSKFNGELYLKLGFSFDNISIGRHWYNPKLHKHITDNLLRQRGFDQLLGKEFGTFGKGVSNDQLMLDHGFVEIYDAGQASYSFKKK